MAAPMPLRADFDAEALRVLAVLPLDQAGWHTTKPLRIPATSPCDPFQPARPNSTPSRTSLDNGLGSRIFQSSADILDHCCDVWITLIAQPWRIRSIGMRQWVHEF